MTDKEVADLKARADKAHADKAIESPFKTFEGQITGIDYDKRLIRIKGKDGETTLIEWAAEKDETFKKQKLWWFVRCTGEIIDHTFKPIDIGYFEKPTDWPVSQKGYREGKPFTPRNEKIIVIQSSLKVCADLFQYCTTPDTQDYEAACDLVYNTALAMTEKIMKDTVMK